MPESLYCKQGTGKLESVAIDDWTPQTLPTWRHSNWVGVWDPWPVIFKFNPFVWYKVRCHTLLMIQSQNTWRWSLQIYEALTTNKSDPHRMICGMLICSIGAADLPLAWKCQAWRKRCFKHKQKPHS